jgi:hypothetical protein
MGQNVPTAATADSEVAIFDAAGAFRALAVIAEGRLRPIKVFPA